MDEWKYETCLVCDGSGRYEGNICYVCEGFGLWEFKIDNNYKATKTLLGEENYSTEEIVKLCNKRLEGITPDNIISVLDDLQDGLIYGTDLEEERFHALHQAGTIKWAWTWLNANRFAKALGNLNNVKVIDYRYALTKLAWNWLENEGSPDEFLN